MVCAAPVERQAGGEVELGSMEAIKEIAKTGLGAGVLAPWIAREELRSRSLIDLPLGRRPPRCLKSFIFRRARS